MAKDNDGARTEDEVLKDEYLSDAAEAWDDWYPNATHALINSEGKIHTTLGFSVSLSKKIRGGDELKVEMTTQPRQHLPKPMKRYKLDIHKGKQLVFQGLQ